MSSPTAAVLCALCPRPRRPCRRRLPPPDAAAAPSEASSSKRFLRIRLWNLRHLINWSSNTIPMPKHTTITVKPPTSNADRRLDPPSSPVGVSIDDDTVPVSTAGGGLSIRCPKNATPTISGGGTMSRCSMALRMCCSIARAGDGQVEQVVTVMAPIMGTHDVGMDVVVFLLGIRHRVYLASMTSFGKEFILMRCHPLSVIIVLLLSVINSLREPQSKKLLATLSNMVRSRLVKPSSIFWRCSKVTS
mmetsp:Transcript_8535/g.10494  ORF Transcript_8535/g.10494 Transcript_8535/m.10494 type:complete len:247 (+) Transcript_8535:1214-1954(+)